MKWLNSGVMVSIATSHDKRLKSSAQILAGALSSKLDHIHGCLSVLAL